MIGHSITVTANYSIVVQVFKIKTRLNGFSLCHVRLV